MNDNPYVQRASREEEDALLKYNALLIVREHKKMCKSSKCQVSTGMIGLLIERAGIKLSKEEWREFL